MEKWRNGDIKKSMKGALNVYVVDPFLSASHQSFWTSLKNSSAHNWEIFPAGNNFWKLSSGLSGHLDLENNWKNKKPDVLVISDFFDLATFKGLNPRFSHIPSICYFHENQFEYPVADDQKKDAHFSLINLRNFLTADISVFNSNWNYKSFLGGISKYRRAIPAEFRKWIPTSDSLKRKDSRVIYPGVEVPVIPAPKSDEIPENPVPSDPKKPLRLIWPHRWEYDKGPSKLFSLLEQLAVRNISYEIDICGPVSRGSSFPALKSDAIRANVVRMGPYERKSEYFEALKTSDVVLSTASHEFFGIAVLEAVLSGCTPVLPDGLSYPEIYGSLEKAQLYSSDEDFLNIIENLSLQKADGSLLRLDATELRELELKYSPKRAAEEFDTVIEKLVFTGK